MVSSEHDVGLLLVPSVFVVLGGLVLLVLSSALKFVGYAASKSFALEGPAQKAVQPIVATYVKPALDMVLTLPSKFTFEHVLLTAILIVLVGMWRTQHIAVQHMEVAQKKATPAAKKTVEKSD